MKLEVKDVQFAYNGRAVLSDVSFSLQSGKIMCVLGINGAGKSTLLKCLNRILEPRSGSVLVNGENLLAMSQDSVARRMGYVPQRHPEIQLTVFEAVLMGRKPHIKWALSEDDYARAERVIRQMGIEHLSMRPMGKLSGGEIQKVVVARALAQSPEILLLDEPTSNLDLKSQLEVMGLIRSIVEKEGLSAVVAVHDLNMALRFADEFLFLKDHRIHAVASRQEITPEVLQQVYGVDVELVNVGENTIVSPL